MEKEQSSQVWLVNLESTGLGSKLGKKYSKQKLFEYTPGQDNAILFPVGYVIQHASDYTSTWEDYGDGFQKPVTAHATPIYTGVDISHLEGELLTVMDASFADKKQCEAIKSLVRNTLWRFNANQERKVKEIFKSA